MRPASLIAGIRVAGLDGCKAGWVGVLLDRGRFAEARVFAAAAEATDAWPDVSVMGIDIPIGLAVPYPRQADVLARVVLGTGAASVFMTPPRQVLEQASYPEALALSSELLGKGLSRQSWSLRAKILEVDALARREGRVYEVHPEVSFREMAGTTEPAWHSKRTWNGLAQRRACLASAGIVVPDDAGTGGLAGPDDVLDAAAAAWSAGRIASGSARTLPDPPQRGADRDRIAIYC